MEDEIYGMPAVWLRCEIQKKHIGVEELLKGYLKRIEKYDGTDGLNTVAELDSSAIQQARAMDSKQYDRDLPLFGLPVLIKDNIDVAGLHTTAGSLAIDDNLAAEDAPVINNLRRAGAIILGKTNMTEFANYTTQSMPNGYSSRGGQVKNAYGRRKDPSGSSSGSAVAVSAGFCAAAIGTDTSFSIIGCATVNGVAGLKPPHGSLSAKGIVPISHTLDSAGPLTHDFSDALMLYSGMRDAPLPTITPVDTEKIHIAINTFGRNEVSEAQLAHYNVLFEALHKDGVRFSEVSHAHSPYQGDIMRCEFRHDLEEYLTSTSAKRKTLSEIVKYYETNPEVMMKYGITYLKAAMEEASGKLDDEPYLRALSEREKQHVQLIKDLHEYDACVMTGPTNIMHFAGLPSVALKLCMADDNMPRGIILYGVDELKLYAAARTIERYCMAFSLAEL